MKKLSIIFIFSVFLTNQFLVAEISLGVFSKDAQSSAWLKSLRMPSTKDVLTAKAYVYSKWRCLRYGENCSKKERVVLTVFASIVTVLLARVVNTYIYKWTGLGKIQLWKATRDGDLNEVKKLLKKGVNPNFFWGEHWEVFYSTPLMIAKNPTIVEELLKANADPNMVDKSGSTALIDAMYSGKNDIVKLLLQNKHLDINAHHQGALAFRGAFIDLFRKPDIEVVEMLLARTVDGEDEIINVLNWSFSLRQLTREQASRMIRYVRDNRYLYGKKEYEVFSHGLILPQSPIKKLPREVMGKIFEYVTKEPLSQKQREKLMERS